jgi:hypothetical protein
MWISLFALAIAAALGLAVVAILAAGDAAAREERA